MAYAVGDTIAARTVHLDRESLVRYAGASGDFNPIHYRDDIAASVGLPGVLAHGMLTMGIASSVVVAALEPGTRILDYGVRFTKPVVVDPVDGADVHVLATVGAVDGESARIDLKVTFDETTVLVKAQLRVAV
ncbi:hypothetical protein SRABI76_00863 [Microbacterium oxydans]|uniref:Bifunctional enoyl-CoA hydratase/phosphate acetyltransferase n=1 Tax=Microbacterium oxydans TaxID=82380 RepID=A0A0F0LDZ4_9MICO|nr:MaoC/PaaZ C-terminal domain-containing protein [Microbacterium oxydans]KJL29751.1 bifunctional enoyl-CoA hydratase/phosphate acetyltransferase [Microbacterium oxydans]CAH0154009.1 hypothetical protein SRABI76_00863 [Microbacterium oxydans]